MFSFTKTALGSSGFCEFILIRIYREVEGCKMDLRPHTNAAFQVPK
jgi:hypothetical protein